MKASITLLLIMGAIAIDAGMLRPWHERRPWDRARSSTHYHQVFRWHGAPYYYFPEPYHLLQQDMCLEADQGILCHYRDVSGKVYWHWKADSDSR